MASAGVRVVRELLGSRSRRMLRPPICEFFLSARRQEKRRERKKAVEEEEAEAEGGAEEDKEEEERGQRTEFCTNLVALVMSFLSRNVHFSNKSSF